MWNGAITMHGIEGIARFSLRRNSDHLGDVPATTHLEETPASFRSHPLVNSGMGWVIRGQRHLFIRLMNRTQVIVALSVCIVMLGSGCAKSAHQTGEDQLQRLIPSPFCRKWMRRYRSPIFSPNPVTMCGTYGDVQRVGPGSRGGKGQYRDRGSPTADGSRHVAIGPKGTIGGTLSGGAVGRILDPAVIEKDSPVTVVGEVKGATTKPLDEGEYQYPVLDIKQLVDWNEVRTQERDTYYDSPYAGRYGGYYGPGHRGITAWQSFRGPYGFYPYSYYGPYYGPIMGFPRLFGSGSRSSSRLRPFHPNSKRLAAHEACDGCQPAPTLSPQTQFREDAGTRRASRRDPSDRQPPVRRAETCRHTSAL